MDGALLASADVPYYIFHVKLNAQNNIQRSSRTDADTQSKPSRTKPTHTIFTARNLFDACFSIITGGTRTTWRRPSILSMRDVARVEENDGDVDDDVDGDETMPKAKMPAH